MRLAPRSLLLSALVLAWMGCLDGAPRDNPLDPLSDGFRDEGGIQGRVTGIYPPFDGRAGISVSLTPVGPAGRPELATRTDDTGRFALSDVPAGPYAVGVEEEGFRAVSDTVTVEAGSVAEVGLQLDALPVVVMGGTSLRTVHIVRWFPEEPVFQLEVEVEARDPDRPQDIAGAALTIPTGPASAPDTVRINAVAGEPGRFVQTFDGSELPFGVQDLLGRALHILVWDVSGGVARSESMSLVRVIDQSPQTQSPVPGDNTGPTPTLVWRPAELPFAFTYWVDLYVRDGGGGSTLIERVEDISPSQTSHTVAQTLAAGSYWWAVWVVDAAGNRSRSKQAGFDVL